MRVSTMSELLRIAGPQLAERCPRSDESILSKIPFDNKAVINTGLPRRSSYAALNSHYKLFRHKKQRTPFGFRLAFVKYGICRAAANASISAAYHRVTLRPKKDRSHPHDVTEAN